MIGAKPPAPGEEEPDRGARRRRSSELGPHGRAEVAPLLTLDTDSPASVVSCVARARERGRTLRDVISTEMWEALNSFYLPLGRYDLQAALLHRPLLGLPGGQGALRAVLGPGRPDDAARRGPLVPGGRRPDRGGRHGAADAAGRGPGRAIADDASGHEAEALALLHAVGGFQAYRRAVRQAPDAAPGGALPALRRRLPGLGRLLAGGAARRR